MLRDENSRTDKYWNMLPASINTELVEVLPSEITTDNECMDHGKPSVKEADSLSKVLSTPFLYSLMLFYSCSKNTMTRVDSGLPPHIRCPRSEN